MKNKLPLVAFAALPLTVGLAFAQTERVQPIQPDRTQSAQPQNQTPPGIPERQPAQPGQPRSSGTNYADVFLQKLAAQLGITVDQLRAAAVAAGRATTDQGVKAGDFSSDRAAEMKERLNENPFVFGGRGPGGRGDHGMHGRGKHRHDHGESGGRMRGGQEHRENQQGRIQDGEEGKAQEGTTFQGL